MSSYLPGSQIREEEIESNSPHYKGPQNDEHDQGMDFFTIPQL